MFFVISSIIGNKHYYVELKEDGTYEGCLITNYVAGSNTFNSLDENKRVVITDDMLLERVQMNNRTTSRWFIMGKVVSMKDSSIKLIV